MVTIELIRLSHEAPTRANRLIIISSRTLMMIVYNRVTEKLLKF